MVSNPFEEMLKRVNQKADQKLQDQQEKLPALNNTPPKKAEMKETQLIKVPETTNASTIKLPSGQEIQLYETYLPTEVCKIWTGNNRLEETRQDESLQELIEVIRAQGQLIPGFVRPVKEDPNHQYEVIYGSRRFAACQALSQPFYAIVGELSDKDALILMDAENNARKELSVYEKALSFKEWLKSGVFSSREDLATHLGVSAAWVSRVQSILKLPEEVLGAFNRKTDIKIRWVIELVKLLGSGTKAKDRLIEAALKKPAKLVDPKAVYQYLMAWTNAPKPKAKSDSKNDSKIVIKNKNGKVVCELSKGNDGKTKVTFDKSLPFEDIKAKLESLYATNEEAWEF